MVLYSTPRDKSLIGRSDGRYIFYSLGDSRVTEILRLAKELLRGSEVYLMTCNIIGKTDQNLTNVTGWQGDQVKAGGTDVNDPKQ